MSSQRLPTTLPPTSLTPTSTSTSSSTSVTTTSNGSNTTQSLIDFWMDNWKWISVALAVAGAAGAVYFATKSKKDSKKEPKEKKSEPKQSKKKVSGKKEKKEKKEDVKEEKDEPVKDEKKPLVVEKEKEKPKESEPEPEIPLEDLTETQRVEKAKRAKDRGNKFFGAKQYEKAIELYTEAIKFLPTGPDAAIFYSNRAACYANMGKNQNVIEDCTEALKIDKKYVKALNRRATAYEAENKIQDALIDITASCLLDGFTNQNSLTTADKLLKTIGTTLAADYFPTRTPSLPSSYFVTTYLESFKNKGHLDESPAEKGDNEGDVNYLAALELIQAKQYGQVLDEVQAALRNKTSFEAEALNLQGTWQYFLGNLDLALEDFEQSLKVPNASANARINTLIKKASVLFEKKETSNIFKHFDEAISINKDHPDIYYHRAQVHFLSGNFQEALDDYQTTIKLSPDSPYAYIQLGVVYYRLQSIQTALETFQSAIKKFAGFPEIYNYYGEILLDLQKFDESEENFKKAIDLANSTPGAEKNPLSYINLAFANMKKKPNEEAFEEGMKYLNEALIIDEKCEIAHAHIAQLYIQIGKLPKAIEHYNLAVSCARTEADLVQWFSCREAANAQMKVLENYPDLLPPNLQA